MKELEFLKIIAENIETPGFLGDDCAYLEELGIVISQDSLAEDVHFKLSTTTARELGFKAVAVNVSDICASGAKPLYLTIGLSGRLDNDFVREFYKGVNDAEKEFEVKVVGGDLTGAEKIFISICALGKTKGRNISSRKNAKEGYAIGICGMSGSSAKGFLSLERGEKYLTAKHLKPEIQYKAGEEAGEKTKFPYAMMDTSDGLFDALEKIAKTSKVNMVIEFNKIPREIEDNELVLFGGEDYSLLIAADERDFKKLSNFVQIGKVKKGTGKVIIDGKIIAGKGLYDHFSDNNRGG